MKNKKTEIKEIDEINLMFGDDFEDSLLSEVSILTLGFIQHADYTYKLFFNNVYGYLDELEVFFEPNERICITLRQRELDTKEKEISSIFIRDMEYIEEIKGLISILTGNDLNKK